MPGLLDGRVAIVTGASRGIGVAVAAGLAAEGAHTVVAARSRDELERVAQTILARGDSARAIPCDVTNEDEVVALVAQTVAAYGRLDILVNNAGITAALPIDEMSLAYWNNVLAVNLTSAFLASREAVKAMKAQRPQGGRIITMGSISSITPRPHSLGYTATKHALEGLTHQLTMDGRAYGVVASIVRPGATLSGFSQQTRKDPKAGPGATPQDYIMDPADVARVVTLMCALPPEVNLYEATILPNNMRSFISRG